MPSVSVVRDRLIARMARGYEGRDQSALGLPGAEKAGLGDGSRRPTNWQRSEARIECTSKVAKTANFTWPLAQDWPGHSNRCDVLRQACR
jgi:hypothetical protein